MLADYDQLCDCPEVATRILKAVQLRTKQCGDSAEESRSSQSVSLVRADSIQHGLSLLSVQQVHR